MSYCFFLCKGQQTFGAESPFLVQEALCVQSPLQCITQWDSPQTLLYCDPPYVGADQGHYHGFTAADHAALVTALGDCQGAVLLSGYDQAIPPNWQTFTFPAHCSASGQGKVGNNRSRQATVEELGVRARTEYVHYKPRTGALRPEIVALYASGAYDCFPNDTDTTPQLGLFPSTTQSSFHH